MNLVELARRLENMIRLGTIHSVEGRRCRVESGDLLTTWLPWFAARAGDDTNWWPPSVGEQVTVFSPSGDLAQGLVLVGLYSDAHPPSTTDQAIREIAFADGTVLRYNKATHRLVANVQGDIDVRATGNIEATAGGSIAASAAGDIQAEAAGRVAALAPVVQVDAATITFNGAVQVNGPLTLAGPLSAAPGAAGSGATLQGNFSIEGNLDVVGTMTNNGVAVGSTLRVGGVTPGPGTSGNPV